MRRTESAQRQTFVLDVPVEKVSSALRAEAERLGLRERTTGRSVAEVEVGRSECRTVLAGWGLDPLVRSMAHALGVEGVLYEADVTFFDGGRSARLDAFRIIVGKDGTLERQPFEDFDEKEDFSGDVGEVVEQLHLLLLESYEPRWAKPKQHEFLQLEEPPSTGNERVDRALTLVRRASEYETTTVAGQQAIRVPIEGGAQILTFAEDEWELFLAKVTFKPPKD